MYCATLVDVLNHIINIYDFRTKNLYVAVLRILYTD